MNPLRDLTRSLGDLITVVRIMGLLAGEKTVTYFGSHYLNLCFLLPVPILCPHISLQCTPIVTKKATSVLVKSHSCPKHLLADCSGHIAEEGCV